MISSENTLDLPDSVKLKRVWIINSNLMWGPHEMLTNDKQISPLNKLPAFADSYALLEYEDKGERRYIKGDIEKDFVF